MNYLDQNIGSTYANRVVIFQTLKSEFHLEKKNIWQCIWNWPMTHKSLACSKKLGNLRVSLSHSLHFYQHFVYTTDSRGCCLFPLTAVLNIMLLGKFPLLITLQLFNIQWRLSFYIGFCFSYMLMGKMNWVEVSNE